jgi:Rps23 Pro-64 3,4-dihydroxylase Tpa1-like proline 4-hydroxylase
MSTVTGMKKKQKASGIGGKKKQRTEEALKSPISKDLYSDKSVNQLKAEHDSNLPYKHVVFRDLCSVDCMRLIHEEAKNNMTATFKETDLFKVRTVDLR